MALVTDNYFMGSNTCCGFKFFPPYQGLNLERVFIFKGGPGTGKSTFMKKVLLHLEKGGYNQELFWCSSDPDSLDGIIFPELKLALVDGTHPHILEAKIPGAQEEIINLGDFWDSNLLLARREQIEKLQKAIQSRYSQAYNLLARAQLIQVELEIACEKNIDRHPLQERINLLNHHFAELKHEEKYMARNLFASSITSQGPRNFFNELTEDYQERIIFTGYPRSIISHTLKHLSQEIANRGHNYTLLRCGFDEKAIDGLLLPWEKKAILNGNWPHIIEPRSQDFIVNLNDYTQTPAETKTIEKELKSSIKEAASQIKQAQLLHCELEEYYIGAMDYNLVEGRIKNFLSWLDQWQEVKYTG